MGHEVQWRAELVVETRMADAGNIIVNFNMFYECLWVITRKPSSKNRKCLSI